MKILGLVMQHDAGAAVIENGRILSAVNEERLNRQKMYWGIPKLSIGEALRLASCRPGDIDAVVFSNLTTGNPIVTYDDIWRDPFSRILQFIPENRLTNWIVSTNLGISIGRTANFALAPRNRVFKQAYEYLRSIDLDRKFIHIEHHNAHAASAWLTSGWSDCLVITLDAVGDGYCSKIFKATGGRLREIHSIPFFHSPGYYYGYITYLCDFKPGRHEGKITGLAAHGNPDKVKEILNREIYYDRSKFSFINRGGYLWPEIWRLEEKLAGFTIEDMAAGVQSHLEDLVSAYVADAVKRTGIKKVALAGGVFANVRLNQKLLELPGIEGIWIHPHMGDGGLGAGAALGYWARASLKTGAFRQPEALKHVYLGQDYTDEEIETALKNENCLYTRETNIELAAADRLAKGKVVARFFGRMEYGPRALGNRSMLYQATDPKVNDWLNKRLKRTEFMPFAPVILEEDAAALFNNYDERSSHASEFMTITYDATVKCKKEAPAVVHIDGTARPQVVKPGANPSYEKILREYKKLTGLSVLINTSFNMHEEPIVCTPSDAVRSFKQGHIDYLAIGSFLAENRTQP
ncbi:MAG TPA: hypothetical protein DEE98_03325 [Elusimicrobia bacterium]|nr:MAG: hypothetical protein A2278_08140 [Elusimicrobia bacterium RIFOXYA12_FULL_49_49]OGS10318.1 MAG: hypothetical protein A2386_04200 [Elusimicrobia bacterium RIFOXYB1_FULL_48_9]OGS15966.1 MAG: hypothetical protein A2251_02125 [Elusimicrobia bacterium RIFOXYA2_FULL_47_53]OGS26354.1 MAG: hypothetical protein A2339_03140 [Elusimicrobia bacterium RIFOXYB12_FULL_50_12]OGS29134.1 MAG: hypothetical protein A2323_04665 [Elusimicrobia bacterium RIFOXYB2_FULL_46_23]HBU69396.1 hypothetical protein [El